MASDVDELATRILTINFAIIHPISIFLSQTLFEMAQMLDGDVDSVRTEITEVLEQEGGWNEVALNRFRKVDSILREVGRVHGLALFGMARIAIATTKLPIDIPCGSQVVVDLRHFHRDPQVYPNPRIPDPFRFSRLGENGGNEAEDIKYSFTTVDNHFLPFGAGRHVCPGRFFASMQLKIMVAVIVLKYEFKFPGGKKIRPKDVVVDGFVMPPVKEHLLFKPRSGG